MLGPMRPGKIARTLSAMLLSRRPVILYHKPTARCDCRCRFCDSWLQQPDHDDTISSDQGLALLDEAQRAGMTMYVVWGGEPLLVEQLPAWLHRARGHGMRTVVCTSGSRLQERAAEIGPHTERLLLSLEGIGARHDRLRGRPGLFERMVAGLDEYRRHGREVIIWSNLNGENTDQVPEILRFAREYRVGVEFFPTARFAGYNEKLLLGDEQRRQVFAVVKEAKRRGWPVLNTWHALELMSSGRSFVCNTPLLSIQVAADGDIYPCDPRLNPGLQPCGHLGELDLKSPEARQRFARAGRRLRNCNNCLLPCVADMADNLSAQVLRKMFNRAYYRLHR